MFSTWGQRNLERGSSIKILRSMLSDETLKTCTEIDAVDISQWYVYISKSPKKRLFLKFTSSIEYKKGFSFRFSHHRKAFFRKTVNVNFAGP